MGKHGRNRAGRGMEVRTDGRAIYSQAPRAGECCSDAGAGAGAVGLGLEALLQQSRSWQQVSGEG